MASALNKGPVTPAAMREANAAAYLDLPIAKFRTLVKLGALPRPVRIADGIERWRSDELRAILNGDAAMPDEDFEL